MKKTRITQIIIEPDKLPSVKDKRAVRYAWCGVCGTHVCLLTPETIAFFYQINARLIYRLLEIGQIHFAETLDGLPLICFTQLAALAEISDAMRERPKRRALGRTCNLSKLR